jgi:excisionase family DNA binding protein
MPSSEITPSGPWLSLSDAARYLGVHFTTLRRWADAGEVPYIRTPGGRRRFALPDLQRFLDRLRQPSTARASMPLETRALDLTRQHIQTRAVHQEDWFACFNEQRRLRFRDSGRRLFGLLIQFSSRSDAGEVFLEEGKLIAREYGTACSQAGLSITETVKAFLFFRRSLLDAVHETSYLNGPNDMGGQRLYQRMSDFLDTILLNTIESYCKAYTSHAAGSVEGQ